MPESWTEMHVLSPIQVRVLGCLMEKAETTPDQYPLTLNSLRLACNQKTARDPVVNYSEGEVGHAVRELQALGLAREAWGARVAKYEHQAGKILGLQSPGLAVMCVLMLRGPQTLGEIRTHSQRLHEFGDLDDVANMLRRLAEHQPCYVTELPRQPGQKETRYAHLLSGKPEIPAASVPVRRAAAEIKLDHITLLASSLERSMPYYDHLLPLLGFQKQRDHVWSNAQGFFFQFRQAGSGTRPYERYGAGMNHLGFGVATVEKVEEIRQTMLDAGFEVPEIQDLDGVKALFMKDPDGIRFEVSYYPPGARVVD